MAKNKYKKDKDDPKSQKDIPKQTKQIPLKSSSSCHKGISILAELDIVALRLKENVLDVIEVKRNPEKFNRGLLEEKTAYFSSKEKQARKNKLVLSCFSMDDM